MRFAFGRRLDIALPAQSPQHGLYGGGGDPPFLRKLFPDLLDGGLVQFPDDLENLRFGRAETGHFLFGHRNFLECVNFLHLYEIVKRDNGKILKPSGGGQIEAAPAKTTSRNLQPARPPAAVELSELRWTWSAEFIPLP